jgi:FdhD protein
MSGSSLDLGDQSLAGVHRWIENRCAVGEDSMAAEEPLEIRLAGMSIAVTMRTPGDDFDLVRGFLFTEGIVDSMGDIASIGYCEPESPEAVDNAVNVNMRDPRRVDPGRWQRNFYMSSSCGVCGKATIASVRAKAQHSLAGISVGVEVLYALEPQLRNAQRVFARTGGLHAAGLFDDRGDLLILREDVGRHNAVDKVIGAALYRGDVRMQRSILMVSGRCSFEVVQKALMAGIPLLAGVSAPTSLAVALAKESGMTLVGFLRGTRCNVYAGADRVGKGR